jgi:hypothetical protein
MAMINCGECGANVSTEAKSCPGCGASRKVFRRSSDAGKRISWPKKIGIGFGALFGLSFIVALANGNSGSGQAAPAEGEQERQADAQRGSVAMLSAKALKDSLRNPDSLTFVYIHTNDDGSIICMKYRAQNGFGGMNIGYVVYKDGQPSDSPARFNKHCAHKTMHDLTQVKDLI